MRDSLCFIYFNVINDIFYGADYELNSSYIRSYLKNNGIETKQYINREHTTLKDLVDSISSIEVNRFVFYINEYNFYINKVVINNLKERLPDSQIIITGPSAEYIRNYIKPELKADMIVTDIYTDIWLNIADGSIENVIENPSVNQLRLNNIPLPYSFEVVPVVEVLGMGLLTSIGCRGRCNFCSYAKEGKFDAYQCESIISELKYIKEYLGDVGVPINFNDECFSLSQERTIKLCNEFIRNDLKFSYSAYTRLDLLSNKVIDTYAKTGFRNIVVGLESASEKILGGLGKLCNGQTPGTYLNELVERYQYAKEMGLEIVITINLGLLNETIEDAYQTLDFLKANNIHMVSVNYLTIFPLSRIFRDNNFHLPNCNPSATGLPLKTFYHKGQMNQIYKRIVQSPYFQYNNNLAKHHMERCDLVDYYTGICKDETIFKKKEIKFIDYKEFIDKGELMYHRYMLQGYLIYPLEKLTYKDIYCDNRKLLKYDIQEYDEVKQAAYEQDLYFENIIFQKKDNGKCTFIINNCISSNRYIFKLFDKDCVQKVKHVDEMYHRFMNNIKFTFEDFEEFLFDDMYQFVKNTEDAVEPQISAYLRQVPLIYILIHLSVFIYKYYNKNSTQLTIYSIINYNLSNSYVEFQDENVFISNGNTFACYNAKIKLAYLCNTRESKIIKKLIEKETLYPNDFIELESLKIKLEENNIINSTN